MPPIVVDRAGEGRERDGVRAEIHLRVAIADGERRAAAGADQQILLAGKQKGERERPLEPLVTGSRKLSPVIWSM